MRRSREEIAVGILRSCAKRKMPVGRLMRKENLPHRLLTTYLSRLAELELVKREEVGRCRFIQTTQRGIDALLYYQSAIAILNGRDPAHSAIE